MQELISLENLSNIEGATTLEAVEQLFETLRLVETGSNKDDFISLSSGIVMTTDDLREDRVVESSDVEKRLIIENFPSQKNNYLIVPKVIEE